MLHNHLQSNLTPRQWCRNANNSVWHLTDFEASIKKGCRLIDTAAMYDNETSVGRAIKESDVPRDALFVSSKLMFDIKTYDGAIEIFSVTMKR